MGMHIPTMFVMVMIASAVMAAAMTFIALGRHGELRSWAGAVTLQVVGYLLISLRGKIPDLASIVVANTVITASIAMYAVGIRRFHGERMPAREVAVPIAVTIAGFLLLIHDYRSRLLLGGAIWMFQCVHILLLLHRRRLQTPGRGQYILLAAVVVYLGAMLERVVAVLTGVDASFTLTDPTPTVVLGYGASITSTILLSIGAITMIQERSEQVAIDSETRYRKLIDSATEGILVVEADIIRLANPKWTQLTGYSADETIGQPFGRFIHPEDLAAAIQVHRERLDGRAEGDILVARCLTKSAGERWFQVSGVAFEWRGTPATLNFVSDVTEQRKAQEKIRELAFHDTLTRLPNRRMFLDRLNLAMAANRRSGRYGAIVFMDLDNFKPLNDRHGHNVGDLLLIEVAHRLLANLRAMDTAARFGGDEFVVLLTDLSADRALAEEQSRQVARKLLDVLAEPYRLDAVHSAGTLTVEHRCTATAGIVLFSNGEQNADALLDRADAAMYSAKQAGRNRVAFADAAG